MGIFISLLPEWTRCHLSRVFFPRLNVIINHASTYFVDNTGYKHLTYSFGMICRRQIFRGYKHDMATSLPTQPFWLAWCGQIRLEKRPRPSLAWVRGCMTLTIFPPSTLPVLRELPRRQEPPFSLHPFSIPLLLSSRIPLRPLRNTAKPPLAWPVDKIKDILRKSDALS